MSLAPRVEAHEAEVWARCIEVVGAVPDDPLGAVVDRSGPVPLPALTSVDAGSFNRVVGLGMDPPASPAAVDRIVDFYRSLNQRHFQIELAPPATPPELAGWLEARGLVPADTQMTKVWRRLGDPDTPPGDGATSPGDGATSPGDETLPPDAGQVRRLTGDEAGAVAALNVRAWGAFHAPVSLHPWFAATVGSPGFAHYGAFVDGRLVCTGAMVVDGELAWIGFDATHPRHQARHLRRALTARRIADARAAGCSVIHAEGRTDRLSDRARMLDTLYVRTIYAPADGSAPPGGGS